MLEKIRVRLYEELNEYQPGHLAIAELLGKNVPAIPILRKL
jgi:hypothetical protein